MTTTRLDLKGVAKDVLQDALWRHKEYTGMEIAQKYGLNDAQLQRVKYYVKCEAADYGVLWGYDDYLGRYRVCPDGDHKAAARILRYAFNHWRRQGRGLESLVKGARLQGLISKHRAAELRRVPRDTDAAVTRAILGLLRVEGTMKSSSGP